MGWDEMMILLLERSFSVEFQSVTEWAGEMARVGIRRWEAASPTLLRLLSFLSFSVCWSVISPKTDRGRLGEDRGGREMRFHSPHLRWILFRAEIVSKSKFASSSPSACPVVVFRRRMRRRKNCLKLPNCRGWWIELKKCNSSMPGGIQQNPTVSSRSGYNDGIGPRDI